MSALTFDEPGGPFVFVGLSKEQKQNALLSLVSDDEAAHATRIKCVGSDAPAPAFSTPFKVGHDVPLRVKAGGDFALEGPGFIFRWCKKGEHTLTIFDDERSALAISNALRACISIAVLEQGGLLLHSAAVVVGGKAHVFFGRSEDGKSTLSKRHLKSGHALLSDDLNVLWPGEKCFVQGVSRAGEVRHRRDMGPVEMASLSRLTKGERLVCEGLESHRAFANLYAAVPFVAAQERFAAAIDKRIGETLALCKVNRVTMSLDEGAHLEAVLWLSHASRRKGMGIV